MINLRFLKQIPYQKFWFLALLILLLSACGQQSSYKKSPLAGGTMTYAISNEPSTFLVRNVMDFYSASILNQIYEGLVDFDPISLEISPALAEKWEISPDGKTISFTLREGVFFHQHPSITEPIKFKVDDVVFSAELACKPQSTASYAYNSIYKHNVKGAKEFFEGKADHISGISTKGRIVTFELLERDINFIYKLAQTHARIVSKEIVEKGLETDLIGTGPFKYDSYSQVDGRSNIVLLRNDNYYQKDAEGYSLPYLDSLVFKVENNSASRLEMFENGETLLIDGLTPHQITSMLGEGKIEDFNSTPPKLSLIRKPLLATHFYLFNLEEEVFKDPRVRKAFNYAIDREQVVKNILNNHAYSKGDAGIIPPDAFSGYNTDKVRKSSYDFNPKKAKELLAAAGYPNGEGFPEISVKFAVGYLNAEVADEVSRQLLNTLNVRVNLDGMVFQDLMKDQESGEGHIFKTSWYADYSSPENFLMMGYSKGIPDSLTSGTHVNYARYVNPKFDEIFEQAKSTTDIVKRFELYAEAEKVLMDDAPYIILWYEETIKIAYSKVRNLHSNQMDFYSFKDTHIKEWTKKEWEERTQM